MKNVSQLSIIFRDKLHNLQKDSVENHDVVEIKKPSDSSSGNNIDQLTSWFASESSSSFQMPLNYPNYTKEEYEIMSEEELDRLLKLYGLPIDLGDLSCKKQFAVGAFLWEKEINSSLSEHDLVNPNLSVDDLDESSLMGLMEVVVLVRNIPPDPDESVSELVEHFFKVNHPDYYLTYQAVYNANKLSEIVQKRKNLQNWLDYYENKHSRNPSKRPVIKIGFLGCFGEEVDAIDHFMEKIEGLTRKVKAYQS